VSANGPVPAIETQGARIPLLGLGTWELRGRVCMRVVEQAVRLGYRHVDTAEIYDNEREVGEGLRASGVKRGEVFVTTKIWPAHYAPRELERAARECLVRLRLSEVDLLLLHWPNPQIPLAETLGALCKVKRDGLARNIGVSNFTVALIEEALAAASEPLVCDQVECHPFLDQSKVIAACRRHQMVVVAYSPIARGNARDDEVLQRIGVAHKKTAAQVCLRFLVQQDIVVIPRTSKVERLAENAATFDFALSEAEMAQSPRSPVPAAASSTGPFPAGRSGIESFRARRSGAPAMPGAQNSTSSSSSSSGSALAPAIHSCISGRAMTVRQYLAAYGSRATS
jgi:2,5-diketo-D-gluconate reductase B